MTEKKKNKWLLVVRLVLQFAIMWFIFYYFNQPKAEPEFHAQSTIVADELEGTITILDVYDGDTFFITVDEWDPLVGQRIGIRVSGVDTPEIRSRDKVAAIEARDYVRDVLNEAETIELRNVHRGKYFRLIAEVYVDGENLAEILIDKGLGDEYEE